MADFGDSDVGVGVLPQRTSILAILSLVCALICIIPGLGVLGVIFGVSALIGISGSRGRVAGTGLAAAGIVLGLLFTMAQVGIFYGATKAAGMFFTSFTAPTAAAIKDLDAGSNDQFRAFLSPEANAAVTDADLAKFRDGYQAAAGKFVSVPDNWSKLIKAYSSVGQSMQNMRGGNNVIPLPIEFDKGYAIVVIHFDEKHMAEGQDDKGNKVAKFKVHNITVRTTDGKTIHLRDPGSTMFGDGPKKHPGPGRLPGKNGAEEKTPGDAPDEEPGKPDAPPPPPDGPK